MDFTNIKCISNECKGNDIKMNGAGGSFGGRIIISKVRCPNCGLSLMIIPMSKDYKYEITAKTEEEIIDEQIEKAREQSEKELEDKIKRIKRDGC